MSKAVVTFTDADDGKVDVSVDFGNEGGNDNSMAHKMAMQALTMLTNFLNEDKDEEETD